MYLGDKTINLWKVLRNQKMRNLSELSFLSKVPYRSLENMAYNVTPNVSKTHLLRLCDYLNCQTHEIMTDVPHSKMMKKERFYSSNSWRDKQGIVYFLQANKGELSGLTKIGFTSDLLSRIKSLEYESGSKLELTHFIPTNDAWCTEVLIHNVLHEKRVQGEWFQLSEADIELFKEKKQEALEVR